MGNNSSASIDEVPCSSLKDFQEKETPRKMTMHILSDNREDCISFVEHLINEKFPKDSDELKEENIKTKINLYSFMNYKIYTSPDSIMNNIKSISSFICKFPKSTMNFSEVILILNNDKINEQIKIIKNEIKNDEISFNEKYFIPFILILSPSDLDLRGLYPSKTFQYKIGLKDILSYKEQKYTNEKDKNENNAIEKNKKVEEISEFLKRIHIFFSYYNELGDIFSFKNSEGEKIKINIEEISDNPAYINVLLLGRSGSGKSTLLNLILDEKKSIEGGTGLSTTSKNLISYRKNKVPIKFFDVKGIENQETVDNYLKILAEHNLNSDYTKDPINAIFYCIKYKTDTVMEQMEISLFEKLIEFNIPILFLITKTPYNPNDNCRNKVKISRKTEREKIQNVIKSLIRDSFGKKNKANEAEDFINNYVKFYFINLRRIASQDIPPFGIDEVLSFFSKSVPKEDWEKLEISCFKNEEENCKKLCEKNPFLRFYSDFDKLNVRNKNIALEFLKGLKAGAFFSGWVPGLDIGMEYFYRYKFKEKLKHLYGFDLEKAEKFVVIPQKDDIKDNQKDNDSDNSETVSTLTEEDFDKREANVKLEESKIDIKVEEEINNKGRNASSIIRGGFEIGGVVIKSLPTAAVETTAVVARGALSTTLKAASWALLPVTCIAFGTWSCVNVHKDCIKMLDIFDQAFTPLKFETLNAYIQSYKSAISYLEGIGKKIIQDDLKEIEEEEEDE